MVMMEIISRQYNIRIIIAANYIWLFRCTIFRDYLHMGFMTWPNIGIISNAIRAIAANVNCITTTIITITSATTATIRMCNMISWHIT